MNLSWENSYCICTCEECKQKYIDQDGESDSFETICRKCGHEFYYIKSKRWEERSRSESECEEDMEESK